MDRILSQDGFRATVRWRGTLKDAHGNEIKYVGVEWDEQSRGKHNGEYKGQKLFDVKVPNSGSFLREATVKEGVKLSDVISDYSCAGGFLSLDNSLLVSIGDISELPPAVKIVNVSNTLVATSQFIWDLLNISPNIECLIMGKIFFVEFPPPTKQYNLKEIVLNNTNITEDQIKMVLAAFPLLRTIDVSFCTPPSLLIFQEYSNLQSIHLDGLQINDFKLVSKALGKMPNLESLSLCDNEIKAIEYIPETFLLLKTLLLKSNAIIDLFSLDGLLHMPKLEDLQVQRNPIQDKIGEVETRLLIVARFPYLKKLNGSPITPSELQQSEIQYLEYFSKDVALNGPQRHPRWEELCQKYGAPQVETEKVVQKKRAAVKFAFNGRTIEKTVPLSMKIGTLSSIITRMFKIQGNEIELAIQTGNYKTSLSYPEQTLLEVGCNDGSTIFAAKVGGMELDEELQAKSFKIRSISQQIEKNDI